jgi:hypothetical protein
MTWEEYTAQRQAIIAALVAVLLTVLAPWQIVAMTPRDWFSLLTLIYPTVKTARDDIASLARDFYDSQRQLHVAPTEVPSLVEAFLPNGVPVQVIDPTGITRLVTPQVDIDLAWYEPDWFEEAMEAVRKDFTRPGATVSELAQTVSVAVKEAQNGGRKTTLRAVDTDPDVIGWARVEGGGESCAFCTMLISRGPVYKESTNAGLDVSDEVEAVEIFKQAEDTGDNSLLNELMTRWHPNCDCSVVPVFDRASWPGKEQFENAERLWRDSTKGFKGKDALNALRRAINAGETGEAQPAKPARVA